MKHRIYVDGQEGTTGLMIHERLAARNEISGDIEVLKIDPDKRRDEKERERYLNDADIVFLCLPDDAARQAVKAVKNDAARIIDASTAHRAADGWAYGLPELSVRHRDNIRASRRVSVPGCFASGFNLIIYPLVAEGLIPADYPVSCHSVTGYSGGGKPLISKYENEGRNEALDSPCFYGLSLDHKHLPEMTAVSGLTYPPLFTPIVSDFYRGMTVAAPFHIRQAGLRFTAASLYDFYSGYYEGQHFINVKPAAEGSGLYDGKYFAANTLNGTNHMEIFVFGNADRAVVLARFDNLGKGSSGAAVQCMNIMLGADERLGLDI